MLIITMDFVLPKKEDIPDAQKFAITITNATLKQINTFEFKEYAYDKYVLISGKFGDENCIILPIYHDWKIETEYIRKFSESYTEKKKYFAMCAPDGSCIFYEAKPFDWDTIVDESNDNCSD